MLVVALRTLFGMEVSLWVIGLTIGGGLTMALAPTMRNVRLAHPFFALATLWSIGCTFKWLSSAGDLPMKYLIAFVIGGGIFALALACYVWVEGNHSEHLSNTETTTLSAKTGGATS
jgi:hypothetical protein